MGILPSGDSESNGTPLRRANVSGGPYSSSWPAVSFGHGGEQADSGPQMPVAEETERELYQLFEAVEAKLKAIAPHRWESIRVTRAGRTVRGEGHPLTPLRPPDGRPG
jgi:hypothetical protein